MKKETLIPLLKRFKINFTCADEIHQNFHRRDIRHAPVNRWQVKFVFFPCWPYYKIHSWHTSMDEICTCWELSIWLGCSPACECKMIACSVKMTKPGKLRRDCHINIYTNKYLRKFTILWVFYGYFVLKLWNWFTTYASSEILVIISLSLSLSLSLNYI